jgi:hypothetical protein
VRCRRIVCRSICCSLKKGEYAQSWTTNHKDKRTYGGPRLMRSSPFLCCQTGDCRVRSRFYSWQSTPVCGSRALRSRKGTSLSLSLCVTHTFLFLSESHISERDANSSLLPVLVFLFLIICAPPNSMYFRAAPENKRKRMNRTGCGALRLVWPAFHKRNKEVRNLRLAQSRLSATALPFLISFSYSPGPD